MFVSLTGVRVWVYYRSPVVGVGGDADQHQCSLPSDFAAWFSSLVYIKRTNAVRIPTDEERLLFGIIDELESCFGGCLVLDLVVLFY